MARIRTRISTAVLALMLFPVSSAADPVRAVLGIDVLSVRTTPSGEPQPFSAQFALPVTFDDGIRRFEEFCCPEQAFARFGDPTFGDIPLAHFEVPSEVRPFDSHGTFGNVTRADDGTFTRFFTLTTDLTFDPSGGETGIGNGFFLIVFGLQSGLPSPSLDPHDMVSAIRATESNFRFFTTRRFSDDEIGFIEYSGTATFLNSEAAPIPEPSSLILLGTAVVGAIVRKRRCGTRNGQSTTVQ